MKPSTRTIDAYFAHRLNEPHLFAIGTTGPDERRELVRQRILARGLADERLGKNREGSSETFRQAFERAYQHNLETGEPDNA